MNKNSTIIWLLIISFLILPSSIGRFFLDIAGGLIIFIFLISLLITGVGWITWKKLTSNMITCHSCGCNYINNLNKCPVCGSSKINDDSYTSIPASSATIDITPKRID